MTADMDARFFASLNKLMKVKLRFRSPDDLAAYRQQFDECSNYARTTIEAADKEAWLKLAAQWQKLARNTALQPAP